MESCVIAAPGKHDRCSAGFLLRASRRQARRSSSQQHSDDDIDVEERSRMSLATQALAVAKHVEREQQQAGSNTSVIEGTAHFRPSQMRCESATQQH
jgi:hypothetical protein